MPLPHLRVSAAAGSLWLMASFGTRLLVASWLLALAFSQAASSTSFAAEQPSKAAMGALELAKHHYQKGHFAKAAELFLEAYGISPNNAFLYNAGRALQRAARLDEAASTFRRYLRAEKQDKVGIQKAQLHLKEITNLRKMFDKMKASAQASKPTSTAGVTAPSTTAVTAASKPPTIASAPASKGAGKKAGSEGQAQVSAATPPVTKAVGEPTPAAANNALAVRSAATSSGHWGKMAVAGGVLAAAGAALLAMAESEASDLADEIGDPNGRNDAGQVQSMTFEQYETRQARVSQYRIFGAVGATVGLGALGAGLYLSARPSTNQLTMRCLPGDGGGLCRFSIAF